MKITINNEEVLCNKDFTINEEMLNTSSVILNNVYPATWEQDKDYTSRFYYPKDYSKCKIFNEIEHPEEREDVEGTNFSINVDTSKEYEVQTLKGQTTQTGTPTPTSPQPINITTGRQVVSTQQGNQLFNKAKINWYRNNNGAFVDETNGNTTRIRTDSFKIKGGKTYTISGFPSGINLIAIRTYNANKERLAEITYRNTFTLTSDTEYIHILCGGSNFTNATNELMKNANIMLNEGNTALPYEEYIGNDYEINLGKNLLNIDGTRTSEGLINTTSGTIISVSGTSSNTYSSLTQQITQNIPIGTYAFSIQETYSKRIGFIATFSDNTTATYHITANQLSTTFTTTKEIRSYRLYMETTNGTTYNMTIKPQLEKGSTKTSFTPYKTPIYLGEIRNTNNVIVGQDYIFRNTTENPLYDSNLEEGQWYIHKEIGRVVYDGSDDEAWSYLNNYDDNYLYQSLGISVDIENYSTNYLCSHALPNSTSSSSGNIGSYVFNKAFRLRVPSSIATTSGAFKTWLSSHNVELYYPLATPTNTLIEDEELINQLNSIELLEGLNNVSVSSANLPFIMSLLYNYVPEYTEEDLLFCGVVENTGNVSLNPRYPHYCNLQVLDFKTFLSEGETLDFVIYEKTILEAINQVIGTISDYGFVLGNVNILHEDEVIGAYSTKEKTAYDVFNYIADITQSRWTTRMVDENIVAIDFYDPSLMPHGTAIDYTQEWFCNNKIIDMSFSYSSRDYRNKQVMLSGEVYANIETTEVIIADGYQTQFNTIDKIGYVSSILLNGNPATIITKEEYNLGYEGDFIYQPGNQYFESVDLISTGAVITIVYFAIIEGREIVLNQEEISRVSNMTDRKGIIARYENRNDATTTSELQAIGQSYLKYKGSPEVSLKIDTLNNIWNIGEKVSFSAPLTELTTEYMVKKKTINYITTQDNIFYSYELSSNFNSETEINYFDNQRSKMMGNIGQGEYISRNIDIENTANIIFYDLEVEEVQLGDNTLQSELQTTLGVE